jgi:hypothetical protein
MKVEVDVDGTCSGGGPEGPLHLLLYNIYKATFVFKTNLKSFSDIFLFFQALIC